MAFFEFPHTRTYDSDLGWLIRSYKSLTTEYADLSSWREEHARQYYDLKAEVDAMKSSLTEPIMPWDGTKKYNIYSIVSYEGTNYIAIQDVPAGILITDNDYWAEANTVVDQLNAIIATINDVLKQNDSIFTNVDIKNSILENIYHAPAGWGMQSITTDGDYIYVGFTDPTRESALGAIVKYTFDGQYVDTLTDDLYHTNGTCIINDELYSADCMMTDAGGTVISLSTISVVDLSTFTYSRRLTTNLAVSFTGCVNINDELYAMTPDGAVYRIDTNTGAATFIKNMPVILGGTVTQDITYYDGKLIYFRSDPNSIEVYDFETATLLNTIPIGNIIENVGLVGELESGFVYNGYLYFASQIFFDNYYVPLYKCGINISLPSSVKDRLGYAPVLMYIDGDENSQTRILNNRFEKLNDAMIRIKAFSGGKYRLSLQADNADELAIESCTDKMIGLYTNEYTYSGHITMYDGNFLFWGNWDTLDSPRMTIATTFEHANIALYGTFTNASSAHNFFAADSRSWADVYMYMNFINNTTDNLTINIPQGMYLHNLRANSYKISVARNGLLNSAGFPSAITGDLISPTMARLVVNQSITSDYTWNIETLFNVKINYGVRVQINTSLGVIGHTHAAGTTTSYHVLKSGSTAILVEMITTTSTVRVRKWQLNSPATADSTACTVSALIFM